MSTLKMFFLYLKRIISILFLMTAFLFSSVIEGQNGDKEKIVQLESQLKTARTQEKLRLFKSLNDLTEFKKELNYEMIAQKTIDQAIMLDSFDYGGKTASKLILFLTNRVEKPEEGKQVFLNYKPYLNKITKPSLVTELYLRGASAYFYSGSRKEALDLYDKTIQMAKKDNDELRYGQALSYKAFALGEMGFFEEASGSYQKALEVFNSTDNVANALTARVGLAILYGKNGFVKESLKELNEVKKIAKEKQLSPIYIMVQNNIGANLYLEEKYSEAVDILKEALDLSVKYPEYSSGISFTYMLLSNSYSKLKEFSEAKEYLNKLESLYSQNSDNHIQKNIWSARMIYFFEVGDIKQAGKSGEKFLKLLQQSSDYEDLLVTLKILAETNQKSGNTTKENQYLSSYIKLNDSINQVHRINAFSHYQTLYETEKRDQQIARQLVEIDLLNAKNKIQFQWLGLATAIIIIISLFVYYNIRQKNTRIIYERTQKALALQEMRTIQLENDLLNKDMEYQRKDLVNFAVQITHSQEWAKILNDKYRKITSNAGRQKEVAIQELGVEIRDKMNFHFETVELNEKIEHIGSRFKEQLKEVAKLTQNDVRLCVLIRMNFTPKQIASLQNITHTSVLTSRYRLKKKLGLQEEDELDQFIKNI